jgi:TATA-binding protein-associated factor
MQRIYDTKITKQITKQPWEIPPQKARSTVEGSIFGQRFLSVTLDESHTARNLGGNYLAALRVYQQGIIKLALTATPLHTGHKVWVFSMLLEDAQGYHICLGYCHDGPPYRNSLLPY